MASNDAPPPKVSKELAHAAEDDWKRSVRDAAKHRAVAQMENYDGFKNMVSVAHLRPWHAENLKDHSGPAPPAFAFAADGTRAGPSRNPGSGSGVAGSLGKPRDANGGTFVPPANSMQFDKTWRRACVSGAARWRYLGVMRDEDIDKVFAVDITGATLGEIAEALAEGFERVVADAREKESHPSAATRPGADASESPPLISGAASPSLSLARWRRLSSARWTACGARGASTSRGGSSRERRRRRWRPCSTRSTSASATTSPRRAPRRSAKPSASSRANNEPPVAPEDETRSKQQSAVSFFFVPLAT